MSEVEQAAAAINKKAKEVEKCAKTFNFQETAKHVAALKTLIEKANALPGANPDVKSIDHEYPFEKQSAYLEGDIPAAIVAKIEAVAPDHMCKCDPVKCQCSSSDETICEEKGTKCGFCGDEIAVGKPLHIAVVDGTEMCGVCARVLWEKVRLKESVVFAIVNLVGDACTEADAPYFQFSEALKLVEETQKRMEEFRHSQRAKVAK